VVVSSLNGRSVLFFWNEGPIYGHQIGSQCPILRATYCTLLV
jgi:hypothetical protein